ncbi:MAG: fatty acid CoA ligase family protein [Planctomycetota bacterium]|nr:fatty acid CoA ligase family protein [Planctomycetota bacterium]
MSDTTRPDAWDQLGELPALVNMAGFLVERAKQDPDATAIRVARTDPDAPEGVAFDDTTYGELEFHSGTLAMALSFGGLNPGDRVSIFVKPGVELIAITFALLRIGAVPVLIDPGMGMQSVLSCVERMAPKAFIGIPIAHLLRRLKPRAFRSVELDFVAGGPGSGLVARLTPAVSLERLLADSTTKNRPLLETPRDAEAAVLFTSGSTGPPKGVTYTHGMFEAQVRALKETYGMGPGEVDVACLPVFALFSPALGMTCVFPELDPSKPATCDPAKLAGAIRASGATTTFGSPAIWRRVVPHCLAEGKDLPSLRRVLVAGAPVPADLIADFKRLLPPGADVHTPYGATESLPVTSLSGAELLEEDGGALRLAAESGAGTVVGRPVAGIDLRLIRITDDPIAAWSDELEVAPGELGEIVVRGPVVTAEYKFEPLHTGAAKIAVAPERAHHKGEVWHRIGDIGRLDATGRLWFQGRKSQRLETSTGLVMPVPVENVFNTHPDVFRSALVGVGEPGEQVQVLVVQPVEGRFPKGNPAGADLAASLFEHVAGNLACDGVGRILFHRDFPVDVRHNAKIHRGQLRDWAATQLAEAASR